VETDLIHTFGPYDVGTTSAVVAAVLAAWRAGTRQRACGRAYLAIGNLIRTCRYRHSSRQKIAFSVQDCVHNYAGRAAAC
jgi:hypothetical protein